MISNGFFFVFFFTSLVILGFPKKEITLFDKTQFCCFFCYWVNEWVGACDVYRFLCYTTHQSYMFYQSTTGICCVWTGKRTLCSFFSKFFFFYLTKAVIKNMQAVFCGYLMQAYMGWYVYETVTFSRYSI